METESESRQNGRKYAENRAMPKGTPKWLAWIYQLARHVERVSVPVEFLIGVILILLSGVQASLREVRAKAATAPREDDVEE